MGCNIDPIPKHCQTLLGCVLLKFYGKWTKLTKQHKGIYQQITFQTLGWMYGFWFPRLYHIIKINLLKKGNEITFHWCQRFIYIRLKSVVHWPSLEVKFIKCFTHCVFINYYRVSSWKKTRTGKDYTMISCVSCQTWKQIIMKCGDPNPGQFLGQKPFSFDWQGWVQPMVTFRVKH